MIILTDEQVYVLNGFAQIYVERAEAPHRLLIAADGVFINLAEATEEHPDLPEKQLEMIQQLILQGMPIDLRTHKPKRSGTGSYSM